MEVSIGDNNTSRKPCYSEHSSTLVNMHLSNTADVSEQKGMKAELLVSVPSKQVSHA